MLNVEMLKSMLEGKKIKGVSMRPSSDALIGGKPGSITLILESGEIVTFSAFATTTTQNVIVKINGKPIATTKLKNDYL